MADEPTRHRIQQALSRIAVRAAQAAREALRNRLEAEDLDLRQVVREVEDQIEREAAELESIADDERKAGHDEAWNRFVDGYIIARLSS